MTLKTLPMFACFICLAACATVPDRYPVTATLETQGKTRIDFRSIEIREVSLPAYAEADEIPREDETGKLISDGAVLWADTPARAVGLELTRHLATLTRARVASEPWPFEAFPEARLDVRFETMLARADGSFQITGQYFVAVFEEDQSEHAGLFDIRVPIGTAQDPIAIAAARGAAIVELAKLLVKDAL